MVAQIEVAGLWKIFGDKPERALQSEYAAKSRAEIQAELGLVVGLRDVSFSVDTGQIFVVMGLSGSGKSTLVRCLSGRWSVTAKRAGRPPSNTTTQATNQDLLGWAPPRGRSTSTAKTSAPTHPPKR